jgi:hypothetical protein
MGEKAWRVDTVLRPLVATLAGHAWRGAVQTKAEEAWAAGVGLVHWFSQKYSLQRKGSSTHCSHHCTTSSHNTVLIKSGIFN